MLSFFNDTPTTEIYTLSLHDALPICHAQQEFVRRCLRTDLLPRVQASDRGHRPGAESRHRGPRTRSEEHTSELQSRQYLVCRLLLEKKKQLPLTPLVRAPMARPYART